MKKLREGLQTSFKLGGREEETLRREAREQKLVRSQGGGKQGSRRSYQAM